MNNTKDILAEIVAKRKADMERLGISFGIKRPTRTRSLHPFIKTPGAILEIKRSSPSKGNIAMDLDPALTAKKYAEAGASAISILTEGNYFHGSLNDIIAAAKAAPDIAILRKDFLLEPEEVDVAYDFGADAVLLIARILTDEKLCTMAARARAFGMTPFIEVRTEDDLRKLKLALKNGPAIAGVNSRDLKTFHIDPLIPAAFRGELPCNAVFESGAQTPKDAAFARKLGFEGILIGEAAAKNPDKAKELVSAFKNAEPNRYGFFWRTLAQKRETARKEYRPLVKICGITRSEDGILASALGADMLGFMFFSKSPRKTTAENAYKITEEIRRTCLNNSKKRPLFVGVVADLDSPEEQDAICLAEEGILDAIQFHGCGLPKDIENADFGYYIAERIKTTEQVLDLINSYTQSRPRTLIDAYVEDTIGGTGVRISEEIVNTVRERLPLWLAGGISAENIREIISKFSPELVDVSSSLESSHGIKDPEKLKAFFNNLKQ
ncbi:MAG: bifunctional indole-3-glycerol phosphate synthase/phosphoribosylanthranilate isomerase [Fibrobacteraceae bacterium]|nr:bifunctional indole-3-glycerol phosphate synthase/phosphoribosylanthranilate isomerase [Fibrobacteraceae bacterium]